MKILYTAGWAVAACLFLAACDGGGKEQTDNEKLPPPLVTVMELKRKDVPLYATFMGQTLGSRSAAVKPQIFGILLKRLFEEGAHVEKGDTLFEIDSAPFKAALEQAQGQLASARSTFENARAFEAMGAQFINVAGYGYGEAPFRYCPDYFPYPEPEDFMKPYMEAYRGKGLWTDSASRIKKAVSVPVITAGRMNEDLAEKVLEDGDADIIGIGRGLWADPEMPRKILEGRPEDIVRCTRCASCEDPVTQPRICRVNPSLGREKEMDMSPAATKKKVMVIGGGPAGMEAARVAALRGHEVTLYEKTGSLGGRIKLASMIKGCEVENVMPIYDYLTTQIRKLAVTVKLNTTVTRELVLREKPDAVVIAASSEYAIPEIPGIHSSKVFTIKGLSRLAALPLRLFGPELLAKLSHIFLPVGKRVVVLGGQIEGVQGAVFLKKRGRDVTIVEEGENWGSGIPERYFQRIGPWFRRKNIRVLTGTKAEEVTKEGVRVRSADGKVSVLSCDSVMVLMPQVASHAFAESLKGVIGEVYEIGSALGADNGLLKHALYDGRRIGCIL